MARASGPEVGCLTRPTPGSWNSRRHTVESDGAGEYGSGAETTPGTSHRETASPAPGADQDAGEAQHAVPVHVLVQAGHGDDAAAQQRELGQDVAVPSPAPAHGLERAQVLIRYGVAARAQMVSTLRE